MMYVTIQGWGPPNSNQMNYASQGVWLENRAILGPGAIAKVENIPASLRNVIRQVTDDEVQEYLDAGREIIDGFMDTKESDERVRLREAALKRAEKARKERGEE